MALDIYGKRNELQKQLEAQQKRFENAKNVRNTGVDQSLQQVERDYGKASPYYYQAFNHAEAAARGAQSAEEDAARNEVARYRKMLDEENQRVSTIEPFAQLQQKQEMRAKEFRTAFPSILDSKMGTARTEARRKIAEGVGNVRAGYNQRGLLYSGLRSGAEADVARGESERLADTALKTQQELEEQGRLLDQDAVDTGVVMGNISKDLASTNDDYRKSLIESLYSKDQARQQAIGGLLGTGAQVAGYGLGAAIK